MKDNRYRFLGIWMRMSCGKLMDTAMPAEMKEEMKVGMAADSSALW
jgi:hypothetical protein